MTSQADAIQSLTNELKDRTHYRGRSMDTIRSVAEEFKQLQQLPFVNKYIFAGCIDYYYNRIRRHIDQFKERDVMDYIPRYEVSPLDLKAKRITPEQYEQNIIELKVEFYRYLRLIEQHLKKETEY